MSFEGFVCIVHMLILLPLLSSRDILELPCKEKMFLLWHIWIYRVYMGVKITGVVRGMHIVGMYIVGKADMGILI